MLVSIYGSTDLFVNEYRSMLAEKLSTNASYHADSEHEIFELLKIRFGEESLQSCEVMLRDLEDSKRVNNSIASYKTKSTAGATPLLVPSSSVIPVDCLIISEHYWPALLTDPFVHHPEAQAALTAYEQAYAVLKTPRRLKNVPQLGTVDLELEFEDGSTRVFVVNPVQASLILFLADRWTLHSRSISFQKFLLHTYKNYHITLFRGQASSLDLSSACEMDEEEIVQRMVYWVVKGVVRATLTTRPIDNNYDPYMESGCDDTVTLYEVIEEQHMNAQTDLTDAAAVDTDDILDRLTVSSEKQEKATLETIENYIKGLLANHDSMTLERLFTMLKLMFEGNGDDLLKRIDMNIISLRKFLAGMVDSEIIDLVDNTYRARRKS
jgi:anaphase-promoting complex subunit 2